MLAAGRAATLLLACTAMAVAGASPVSTLDEVKVEAARIKLSEMRRELVRMEDEFYARYNELNGRDEFDVHCAEEARIGTQLRRRYCRAVYESEAMENEGSSYAELLQRTIPVPPSGGSDGPATADGPPVPAMLAIEAKRPDFRKNMLSVTRAHPELARLLKTRSELAKRYESTRRKSFGRRGTAHDEPGVAASAP
ncbi:MAG: hypothetical protein ABW278_00915 [Steroidobacteraceae bacterium]